MTAQALQERVRKILDEVHDPCSVATGDPLGLGEMGLVEAVDIGDDGHVRVSIRLTSPTCMMVGFFKTELEDRLGALPGVRSVEVVFDRGFDWTPVMMSPEVRRRRAARFGAAATKPG